jgi:hypothetical protein
MRTSDITARLKHSSTAVTRDWIRRRKLVAEARDMTNGEKLYRREDVEAAIAAMPRGAYIKSRPPGEGQHDNTGDQP